MFSRINEFLKPFVSTKEATPSHAVFSARKESGQHERKKQPPVQDTVFSESDVALISTDAIRRLLQETADKKGLDEKLSVLARLEQHGIKSIPVRDGQSVWSALDDAGRFL